MTQKTQPNIKLMAKFSQLAMDFLALHPNAALPPKMFCMGLEGITDLVIPEKNTRLLPEFVQSMYTLA